MSQTQLVKQLRAQAQRVVTRPGVLADMGTVVPSPGVPIFDIVGGPVVIVDFFGMVTTAMQNTAVQLSLNLTTTVGIAVDVLLTAATAALTSHAVGTLYTKGTLGAALNITATGAARGHDAMLAVKEVWVPGVIGLIVAAFTNTGIIAWTIVYIPSVPGAFINPR